MCRLAESPFQERPAEAASPRAGLEWPRAVVVPAVACVPAAVQWYSSVVLPAFARGTCADERPGTPHTSSTETPPTLTRGARRRRMQRERKKMGKLERARAAAQPAPMRLGEDSTSDSSEVSDTAVPVFFQQMSVSGPFHLPFPVGADNQCDVPVCAIQRDEPLLESTEIDVSDAFVDLPKHTKAKKQEKAALCPHSWVSDPSSSPGAQCTLQSGAVVPVQRTFIHIPEPRRGSAVRRVQSV